MLKSDIMPQEIIPIVFAVLFLWILTLSFFLWQAIQHYNKLTRNISEKNLMKVLEHILKEQDVAKKGIQELMEHVKHLEGDGFLHTQKVGLLRFNPFRDTGGDQSFILAMLDGQDNGIVISSLHSRSGTRWYAKRVERGKGIEHELSNEEALAIKEARKSELHGKN